MRRIIGGGSTLLDNSYAPRYSVAAVATRELAPGTHIQRGMGGFDVRGEAVSIAEQPDHLPIGLMFDVVVRRPVEPGQVLTFDDVDLPESLAVTAWYAIRDRVMGTAENIGTNREYLVRLAD